jgi:hypothetical protein
MLQARLIHVTWYKYYLNILTSKSIIMHLSLQHLTRNSCASFEVFHSGVAEVCLLLGCDTASVGIWIPTFHVNIVATSSGV